MQNQKLVTDLMTLIEDDKREAFMAQVDIGAFDHDDLNTIVDDKTLLMCASVHGRKDIMRFLIFRGCNVNQKNNLGWTALMFASQSGNVETVQLLLENGANINDCNKVGSTSLVLAAMKDGCKDVQDLLIKSGANKNFCNDAGWTAEEIEEYKEQMKRSPLASLMKYE